MSKHLIGYGVLVAAVAVLAGQVINSEPEPQKQIKAEVPQPKIVEPADYKEIKKELAKLQKEVESKDEQIGKLRETIDSKTAEVKKIEKSVEKGLAKKGETKEKANDIASALESITGLMDNDQMRNSQKKWMKKRYAGLFKRLNLSEADQEKLLDLMMDRNKQKQLRMAELFKDARNGGAITLDADSFKDAQKETEADKEIADMLGDDYETFDKYEKRR